ncbi:predicted protein [Lichtheimia corymbifera JMRC:FSU:9682]|uniref:Uncharacterized protein n=1 Tax=Lichtheimia corymbifera JMRC:FSU:9682 TaxID=1263082 RepID=A0A068RYM6_9FUNG|nr:predicted protein [Lichtheimia corymbifera JMRC:FSU:9682]
MCFEFTKHGMDHAGALQQEWIPSYVEGAYLFIKKTINNVWFGSHLPRNWSRLTMVITFAKHKNGHWKHQLYRRGSDPWLNQMASWAIHNGPLIRVSEQLYP